MEKFKLTNVFLDYLNLLHELYLYFTVVMCYSVYIAGK